MSQIEDKRLPWQHLRTISIVNVCKMIFKSVKFKLGDFFSLSCGSLQLLRKVPKGGGGQIPQSKLVVHGASFMQPVSQSWDEKSIASCRSYGTHCNLELQTCNSFKAINAIVAESRTDLYFVQL